MAESKTTTDQQREQQGQQMSRAQRGERAISQREAFPSSLGSSFAASPFQLMRRMSE